MVNNYEEIIGKKFNRLVPVKRVQNSRTGLPRFLCVCECGTKKEIMYYHITRGLIRSCGCYNRERTTLDNYTHKLSKHPLYGIWCNMKTRCYNPRVKAYKLYGGKGIYMCDGWKIDFQSFYDWAIESGWVSGLNIDRIDNDGPYAPWNCRIVTVRENCRNKSNNILVEVGGRLITVMEAYEILKPSIKIDSVYMRIIRGWDPFTALTAPNLRKTRRTEKK